MGRKRKGKAVRNNRSGHGGQEDEEIAHAPHSFVIHRGTPGKYVQELARDFRKVMEPFTASKIKVRPNNVLKDFVHIAGALNVSHMCVFTKTTLGPYFKVARFPRGPTLTFRVNEYVLARDVRSSLKRQVTYEKQFLNHPLLIMNGFTGAERQIQLMSSMFQNMFPSINVTKVRLNAIRRCVLLNYDKETGTLEFRHYTIKVVPVGASRPIKKLVVQSKVPNLGKLDDISEFLSTGGNVSESSEGEDEESKVELPQALSSRGNLPSQTSAVKLIELGPRIKLELIKIEEGIQDGEVLYHKYQTKTEEEKQMIRAAREKKKKEKEKRKKEQALNVQKKQSQKDSNKEKSLLGMKKKIGDMEEVPKGFEGEFANDSGQESEADDDEEWYKKEVGVAPDKDLFDGHQHQSRGPGRNFDPRFKKRKHPGDRKTDQFKRPRFGKSDGQKGDGGGGKHFKQGNNSSGGRFKKTNPSFKTNSSRPDRNQKPKRKTQVFNSQGVGPNYKRKK